jgi:hypothetical protein
MKRYSWILSLCLALGTQVFADAKMPPQEKKMGPNGWSIDLGAQYTWVSFQLQPTLKGSTGGVVGKITYQEPWSFYGQFRTIFNAGRIKGSYSSYYREWYTEFVGGYCTQLQRRWTITPYTGLGMDLFNLKQAGFLYRVYYAIVGLEARYAWKCYYVGLQTDLLPTFHQYTLERHVKGSAWTMNQRVGVSARLPLGFRISNKVWFELTPYYRFFPIGRSSVLGFGQHNNNQWGAFASFRFFM